MIKPYLISLALFFLIDLPWIGYFGKRFYDSWLSSFDRTLRVAPALGTYLLLALGISVFVLPMAKGSPTLALLFGALLGAITYGVYDLTNYAVLARFPLQMVLVDWTWGSLLCAVVSFLVVRFSS